MSDLLKQRFVCVEVRGARVLEARAHSEAAMRRKLALGAGTAISVAALTGAASFIAETFDHQAALGRPLITIGAAAIYAP